MNFLEIAQEVDTMSGLQGMIQSVVAPIGAQAVIVSAIRQGFIEIQEDRMTWEFMRRTGKFMLRGGQDLYQPRSLFPPKPDLNANPTGLPYEVFGRWQRKWPATSYSLRNIDMDTGLPTGTWSLIHCIPYRELRAMAQSTTTEGVPRFVAPKDNSDDLVFFPTPDHAYECNADYYVEPQELMGNAQIPILPSRFHRLLAYAGLERVGNYYGNPNLYQRYAVAAAKMHGSLYRDQCPAESVTIRAVA